GADATWLLVPWSPFAWPQCWPWCWWVAFVLDHYSRHVMGFALFRKAPTSVEVRCCLGRAIGGAGTTPRYLVSDKGSPFFPTAGYKKWWHHGRTIKEALQRIMVP